MQFDVLIRGIVGAGIHLAEASAEGAAPEAGLSFNLFWILVSAANFGFFILVLRAAALGPITKMLDERRERIERGLRDAAEAAQAKTVAVAAADESLAEARREANALRAAAERAAAQLRDEQAAALKAELDKMRADAAAEIEAARLSALASIRSEVADLAIGAATKVVGTSMDGERQRTIVGEFLDEQAKRGN
ncbi:MAG: synthase chain [Chloroflexota bacterium]